MRSVYERNGVHPSFLPTVAIVSDYEGKVLIDGKWRDRAIIRTGSNGNVSALKRLTSSHPKVSTKVLALTLQAAVANGHADIVRVLLELGVPADIIDAEGKTPAHVAAANGHVDILRILVQSDVDLEIRDNDGKTVAESARNQKEAIVQLAKSAPEIQLRHWFEEEDHRLLSVSQRHAALLGPMAPVAFEDEYTYDLPPISDLKDFQLCLQKCLLNRAKTYFSLSQNSTLCNIDGVGDPNRTRNK